MIGYHLVLAAEFSHLINWTQVSPDAWWLFAKSIQVTFLSLVGVSIYLAQFRKKNFVQFSFGQGSTLLGWGLLLSVASWFAFPAAPILFGILHLIGFAYLLAPILSKLGNANLALGLFFLLLNFVSFSFPSTFFPIPVGFPPPSFSSLDYFPIIPWLGVVMIGVWLGQSIYPHHQDKFLIHNALHQQLEKNFITRVLSFLGKKTLLLYLLHLPILVCFIWLWTT